MITRCGLCPTKESLMGVKAPFDDNRISHGLCRYHELRGLVLEGLASDDEKIEYLAYIRARNQVGLNV